MNLSEEFDQFVEQWDQDAGGLSENMRLKIFQIRATLSVAEEVRLLRYLLDPKIVTPSFG